MANITDKEAEDEEITEADMLNMDLKGMLFQLPVALNDIKAGDVIIKNNKPVIVISTKKVKKEISSFVGMDADGNQVTVVPTKNNSETEIILNTEVSLMLTINSLVIDGKQFLIA